VKHIFIHFILTKFGQTFIKFMETMIQNHLERSGNFENVNSYWIFQLEHLILYLSESESGFAEYSNEYCAAVLSKELARSMLQLRVLKLFNRFKFKKKSTNTTYIGQNFQKKFKKLFNSIKSWNSIFPCNFEKLFF